MVPKASVTAVQPGTAALKRSASSNVGGVIAQYAGAGGHETVDKGHVGQATAAGPDDMDGVHSAGEQYGGRKDGALWSEQGDAARGQPQHQGQEGPEERGVVVVVRGGVANPVPVSTTMATAMVSRRVNQPAAARRSSDGGLACALRRNRPRRA